MILAGQRRQQCVEANLFLHVIGGKGKFRDNYYPLENFVFNSWLCFTLILQQLSGLSGTSLPAHMVTTRAVDPDLDPHGSGSRRVNLSTKN